MTSEPAPSKREQVQASVLAATEALLAEGAAFADLNIEKVATRAGISRTAFYFYFSDKRELLMRLTEGVTDSLYGEADAWFESTGDSVEELRAALAAIAQIYADHRTLLGAIVEVSTYDAEFAEFWRRLLQRFVEATARRLESGGAKAAEAEPIAFALVWMVERSLYETVEQGRDPRSALEALVVIWSRATA